MVCTLWNIIVHVNLEALFVIQQERMANDPNTFSYSSSSVMSYSNDGRGEPKYFQATKSTKKAPGGVGSSLLKFVSFILCHLFLSFCAICFILCICNLPQKSIMQLSHNTHFFLCIFHLSQLPQTSWCYSICWSRV